MPESDQRKFGLAMSVGMTIVSNVIGGALLGYFLDRWLRTAPWLVVTGVVLGTIGAFASLYRIMSRLE